MPIDDGFGSMMSGAYGHMGWGMGLGMVLVIVLILALGFAAGYAVGRSR